MDPPTFQRPLETEQASDGAINSTLTHGTLDHQSSAISKCITRRRVLYLLHAPCLLATTLEHPMPSPASLTGYRHITFWHFPFPKSPENTYILDCMLQTDRDIRPLFRFPCHLPLPLFCPTHPAAEIITEILFYMTFKTRFPEPPSTAEQTSTKDVYPTKRHGDVATCI